MMTNDQMEKLLAELVRVDFDAVRAYEQAMEQINVAAIRKQMASHRDDHQRHVRELTAAMTRLNLKAPEEKKDFKGFLIEGFTALRSITGVEGALKAMHTNEQITNRYYADAVKADLPADVKAIVQRNHDDERKHIRYVENVIENREWETR